MAMEWFSRFPKTSGLERHRQMQFNIITMTFVGPPSLQKCPSWLSSLASGVHPPDSTYPKPRRVRVTFIDWGTSQENRKNSDLLCGFEIRARNLSRVGWCLRIGFKKKEKLEKKDAYKCSTKSISKSWFDFRVFLGFFSPRLVIHVKAEDSTLTYYLPMSEWRMWQS